MSIAAVRFCQWHARPEGTWPMPLPCPFLWRDSHCTIWRPWDRAEGGQLMAALTKASTVLSKAGEEFSPWCRLCEVMP